MKKVFALLVFATTLVIGQPAFAGDVVFTSVNNGGGRIELWDIACPAGVNKTGRIARAWGNGTSDAYGCWYSTTSGTVTIDWVSIGGNDTRTYSMDGFYSTPYFDAIKAAAQAKPDAAL